MFLQNANNANRLSWVDYARGIAIILVVYRHVVVGLTRTGISVSSIMYNIQEVVFNFRMPLFFILSGIFFFRTLQKRKTTEAVKSKVYTLLYPYILWAGVTIILQIAFSEYSNSKPGFSDLASIILQPRAVAHFWYLLALFNTSILYVLLSRVIKDVRLHLLIALALHYVSAMDFLKNYSLFSDLFYFYPFLFVGTIVSRFLLDPVKGQKILSARHLVWLAPLFFLGQWFWFFHKDYEKEYLYLFFIIILIGSYFFYIFSNILSGLKNFKWIAFIGKHSLYIYILHVFIASATRSFLLFLNPGISTVILLLSCCATGVVIPILLYNALKKTAFIKLFSLKPETNA